MDNRSILIKSAFAAIIVVIVGAFASASLGISFPNAISLHPGETYESSFSIQNVLEPTKNITLEITIENGQEYIQFPEGTTIQLAKGEIKNVPVKISLPKNARADKYNVQILFQPTAAQSQSGTLDLVLAIRKSFDIEVIKKTNNLLIITIVLLSIAVLILILILLKTIRNKK